MTLTIPGAAQFADRRVAILGLGISGRASFDALAKHTSAILSVWDSNADAVAQFSEDARVAESGAFPEPTELMAALLAWLPDLVLIAPAFRQTGPEWAALLDANIPVWSEIELAWHLRAQRPDGSYAPWLCITGTNGKTTTVTMLAAILQQAQLRGVAVGNVGNPAVTAVSDTSDDAPEAFAFELSSFQLAATYSIEPEASICLNFADDHLEWHRSRDEYRDAKANVYNRTRTACIYPVGDVIVQSMVDEADVIEGARAIGISLGIPSSGHIGMADDVVADRAFIAERKTHAAELFTVDDLRHLAPSGTNLPVHILKDAMAAAALARAIDVSPGDIRDALASFAPGAHRIETVAVREGVHWVDDSKATNAHAAKASLLAQKDGATVWIAGGQAKGSRFTDLVERVADRLRAVVVIGVDQEPWTQALQNVDVPTVYIPADLTDPMGEAVREAHALAHDGDTVLLAPACASMDQFASYADRGEKFAQAVMNLGGNHE